MIKSIVAEKQVCMRLYIVVCTMILFSNSTAFATPQFSLLTGNRCINCHVNSQGSGLRNELGWYVSRDIRMIKPADVPLLKMLYALDGESNSFFDGTLTLGIDARFQYTRSARSDDAIGRVFPMQASIYAAFTPIDWLTLEGSYNAGPVRYAGQQSWTASLILQPTMLSPRLRVGHFQPSIGVRYDDHTFLARSVAGANSSYLIAPNFAEYGAELSYEGVKWLTVSAGAFLPQSLAQVSAPTETGDFVSIVPSVSKTATLADLTRSPSYVGRAVLWLNTEDHTFNSYAGVSLLTNQTFSLASIFAGVGLTDKVSLMSEYALSGVQGGRQTRNISAEITVQAFPWLLPFIRGELGTTNIGVPVSATAPMGLETSFTRQAVLGAQWFVLPYVELRPELRYTETEAFRGLRGAVQLHIFY
jgi:hypothetical protein